jgi:D-alanyl-D-alanine carboxypeptidase (penicillin-binding protein 5/6)
MRTGSGPRAARFALHSVLALACAFGQFATSAPPVSAQQQSTDPVLKSPHAILVDAETGAVLFQRNADELVPPASMSKLMLLIMMFMALRAGDLKLDAEFRMSENAWRTGGAPSRTSSMFVPLGKTATVHELLQGIIVQSGNDAAISVAENMMGSEALFAEAMTEQARRLGLKKSVFKNASGLPHPEHLMTVREIAMLARHIIKEYPEYYPMFAQKQFFYRHHKFYNRNPLLSVVPGTDGLKTGYVKDAGYGLVASAKQDDRRLIIAISGAETAAERRDDGKRLLEWGFKNVSEAKLFDAGEPVGYARVWGGERMYMPLVGNGEVSVVLPRVPANPKVVARIYYKGPLKPPVKKGEQVAMLRVTTSTDATSEVPLYAAEDVDRAGFVWRGLDSLLYLATRWIP